MVVYFIFYRVWAPSQVQDFWTINSMFLQQKFRLDFFILPGGQQLKHQFLENLMEVTSWYSD